MSQKETSPPQSDATRLSIALCNVALGMALDQSDTTNIEHTLRSMHSGSETRSTELLPGPSAPLSSGVIGAQTQLPFLMNPVRLQAYGTKSIQTKLPFVKVNDHQDVSDMGSSKDETTEVIVYKWI